MNSLKNNRDGNSSKIPFLLLYLNHRFICDKIFCSIETSKFEIKHEGCNPNFNCLRAGRCQGRGQITAVGIQTITLTHDLNV